MTAAHETVVVAGGSLGLADRLRELWAYRHLVANLVRRDLAVRYKNSVLGFLWSLLSPLLMMLVFWMVFSLWRGSPIPDYHVFVLVALLPWNWFSVSMAAGTRCIVSNAALIKKIYFPREVLPISVVASELVNFLLAVPVLVLILHLSGRPITIHAAWLPVIIVIQAIFTVGLVLILSTANVYYRDTSVILEVVLLGWFFLSPIIYDVESLQAKILHLGPIEISAERFSYIINPLASLIANYRVVLYGSLKGTAGAPALDFLARTAVTAVLTLGVGYWLFIRHSGRFGEEV